MHDIVKVRFSSKNVYVVVIRLQQYTRSWLMLITETKQYHAERRRTSNKTKKD